MHGGFFVVLSDAKRRCLQKLIGILFIFFFFFCGIIDTVMMYHGILQLFCSEKTMKGVF